MLAMVVGYRMSVPPPMPSVAIMISRLPLSPYRSPQGNPANYAPSTYVERLCTHLRGVWGTWKPAKHRTFANLQAHQVLLIVYAQALHDMNSENHIDLFFFSTPPAVRRIPNHNKPNQSPQVHIQ